MAYRTERRALPLLDQTGPCLPGRWGQDFPFFLTYLRGIVAWATFMLMNGVASISVAVLVRGMTDLARKERTASEQLRLEQIKVNACGGSLREGPAQELLNAGALGFLQKPFSLGALADQLKEWLHPGRSTPAET